MEEEFERYFNIILRDALGYPEMFTFEFLDNQIVFTP